MSSAWWLLAATVVALVVGGMVVLYRALFADRSKGRRRCPRCWYDLKGISGLTCPECGYSAPSEGHLHKTRRGRWKAALGLVLLVSGLVAGFVPRLIEQGFMRSLPLGGVIHAMCVYDTESHALLVEVNERLETSAAPKLTLTQRQMLSGHAVRLLKRPDQPLPLRSREGMSGPVTWKRVPNVHDYAINLLWHCRDQIPARLPELQGALKESKDESSRLSVLSVFSTLATPADQGVVIALLDAIQNDESSLVRESGLAVASEWRESVPVDRMLIALTSVINRRRSAGEAGFAAKDLRPDGLRRVDSRFQQTDLKRALMILANYGTEAAGVAPDLIAAIERDRSMLVRGIDVLLEIDPPSVGLLAPLIEDGSIPANERAFVFQMMGSRPAKGASLVPCATRLLAGDQDADVRAWAAWALGRMKATGVDSVACICRAATSDLSQPVRMRAVWALGEVGLENTLLVETYRRALRDESWDVRVLALARIRECITDYSLFEEDLTRLEADPDERARAIVGQIRVKQRGE